MASTLKPIHAQILGATVIELLQGELSDETIAAVDSIKRKDVPEPFNDIVGFMHGMSTHEPLRQSIVVSLLREIYGAAHEAIEKIQGPPSPNGWRPMQSFFFDIFENDHLEDMIEEEIEILPDRELVPGWTAPLIDHAKSTKARHKELILELLDVLEAQIQKRREELTK